MPRKPDAPLIPRAAPCPRCRGGGTVPVLSCDVCAFFRVIGGREEERWYLTEDLLPESPGAGDAFPDCGHALWNTVAGRADCPACGGTGAVVVSRTAAAWGRRDARDAWEAKRAASVSALALSRCGRWMGYTRRQVREGVRRLAPLCGAKCCRSDGHCRRRVVLGMLRCKWHGGFSTGPRTPEGRARIADSNRRRARER